MLTTPIDGTHTIHIDNRLTYVDSETTTPIDGIHTKHIDNRQTHADSVNTIPIDSIHTKHIDNRQTHADSVNTTPIDEIHTKHIDNRQTYVDSVCTTLIDGTHTIHIDNRQMFLFVTTVQFLGGRYFYIQAYKALKHGTTNMEILLVLSTTTSYFYSLTIIVIAVILQDAMSPVTFFETTPMLMVFISLGRWLESIAKGKTGEALAKLLSLQPSEALLVNVDKELNTLSEERLSIKLVHRGDILKVLPGEKISIHAKVISGHSTCDESFITGESMPVIKKEGSMVIRGSVNQLGVLLIETTHIGAVTTLVQFFRLVEEAQTSKVPTQNLADNVADYFVPGICIPSTAMLFSWIVAAFIDVTLVDKELVDDGKVSRAEVILEKAFQYAITVLTVACPCALGLVTPTAVMVGTGVGAKNVILIKGGQALVTTHQISWIVFDKTGKVTYRVPIVTYVSMFVNDDVCSTTKMAAISGTAETNKSEWKLPIRGRITYRHCR